MTWLRMRPMSLFETGDATGEVSLGELLDGVPARGADPGLTLATLVAKASTSAPGASVPSTAPLRWRQGPSKAAGTTAIPSGRR